MNKKKRNLFLFVGLLLGMLKIIVKFRKAKDATPVCSPMMDDGLAIFDTKK